jgi:hypothetical protein
MRAFLLSVIFYSFLPVVTAQRVCTSNEYARQRGNGYTPQSNNLLTGHERDTVSNEIITIPVVIHVIYNTNQQNISDAQIMSQLNALNNDFRKLNTDAINTPAAFKSRAADAKVMFCLAQVDPKNRSTKGIIRRYTGKEFFLGDDAMKFTSAGGDDAWDHTRYLNIWVCNMFGRSLGYATMPGAPADKDGVVINWDVFGTMGTVRPPFDKGRTTTHEVGHWLGLKHIWGDDICGTDDIDDTPPQKSYNFYCPVFPKVSNCSADGNGDMFMNYMDLTDDACMNMFTSGQAKEMRGLFALNGYRNSILNSFACDSSLATAGPLPEEPAVVVKPEPFADIYPNPLNDFLNIIARNDYVLNGKRCSIYNIQGNKVYEQRIKSGDKVQLNLSFLSPGVYFLRLGDDADKKMFKIIKM